MNLYNEAMGRFCSPFEGSVRIVRQWSVMESDEAAIMEEYAEMIRADFQGDKFCSSRLLLIEF